MTWSGVGGWLPGVVVQVEGARLQVLVVCGSGSPVLHGGSARVG